MRVMVCVLAFSLACVVGAGTDWSGPGVSIVGDSYSAYKGTPGTVHSYYPHGMVNSQSKMWWAQVLAELGGHLVSNRSCSGSALCYQYGVCPVLWSMANNRQLGNPDVVLVMGGLNDGWVLEPTVGYGCTETQFRNGTNKLLDALDTDYPSAEKIFILGRAHQDRDYFWGLKPKYRRWLREMVQARGYKLVDLDGYFATSISEMETPQTPHPTASGMTSIANRVINEMRNGCGGYAKAYDYFELDTSAYLLTDYETNAQTRVEVNAVSDSGVAGSCSIDGFCEQLVIASPSTLLNTTQPSQPSHPVRICSIKIYEGSKLLHSFAPVKDKYGNATLYDSVEDRCLVVRGAKARVLSISYANYDKGRMYLSLEDAIEDAEEGDVITVTEEPPDPVAFVGRPGVKVNSAGFSGVTMKSPDANHQVVEKDGVWELVWVDVTNKPVFLCSSIEELLTPVNGKLHIRLGNLQPNRYYSIYTATNCLGPWKCVGLGFEQSEFAFPAPPPTPSFFLKATASE